MVWDRESKSVTIVIEAYGNDDLLDPTTNAIFLHETPGTRETGNGDSFVAVTLRPFQTKVLIDYSGYKLCSLVYRDAYFLVNE